MNFYKKGTFILLLSLIMLLAACSSPGESSDANADENNAGTDDDDNTITIGQISWPENIAVTNMWKVILEDEGYNVDLTLADMGPQMTSVARSEEHTSELQSRGHLVCR